MKIYIALFVLAFATAMKAQSQDNFIGNWRTADGKQTIQIYLQDSSYYAKSNDKEVLIQMTKKSDTQLYGGTYYDEELKTEYEAKLKLKNSNTILVKILNGLSNKRIVWHRVPVNWDEKANKVTLIQH